MTTPGYWRVDGPPPIPPFYGLLAAAAAAAPGVRFVVDTDEAGRERWGNGVEVYPFPSHDGDVFDQCAPGTIQEDKSDGDGEATVPDPFAAFTAYLPVTCATRGVWSQEEYIARARESFEAVESAIVAREFMSGVRVPSNPHLSDAAGTFPNGDNVTSLTNGVSLLEQAIGLTRRLGLIHLSPGALSALDEPYSHYHSADGVCRTKNGNIFIPDFGYADGSQPTGHADPTGTQEWLYATGPIDIRRSEIFITPEDVKDAVDRGTPGSATVGKPNTVTYRVERYYLVDWDTVLQAAVLVDRCLETCEAPE